MNYWQKIIMTLVVSLLFTNCKPGKAENFDYGQVSENRYYNTFFEVKMELPKNWLILSEKERNDLMGKGRNIADEELENTSLDSKASNIKTANLLGAFQFEVGTAVDFNPSLIIIAENVNMSSSIKNGADYLLHTKNVLEQVSINYDSISTHFPLNRINGIDFYKMDTRIKTPSEDIQQTYFVSIIKGFSFSIVITYHNEEEHRILLKAINSIKKIA